LTKQKEFNTADIQRLTIIALLVAMEIVLTRFLSFMPMPFARFGFGFLPIAMIAIKFGPLYAGTAAMMADLIGFWLFPPPFPFFPGFTFTAFLAGAVYGIFLHNKEITIGRIIAAVVIVTVLINGVLDTIWLMIMFNEGFVGLLPARLVRTAIMLPVQIVTIKLVATSARAAKLI